uniref:Uncharacterized protein n=1 Tax=Rhizophora mucronata TaxID=61149 RepID=A0A2P2N0E5_RHIMU
MADTDNIGIISPIKQFPIEEKTIQSVALARHVHYMQSI